MRATSPRVFGMIVQFSSSPGGSYALIVYGYDGETFTPCRFPTPQAMIEKFRQANIPAEHQPKLASLTWSGAQVLYSGKISLTEEQLHTLGLKAATPEQVKS